MNALKVNLSTKDNIKLIKLSASDILRNHSNILFNNSYTQLGLQYLEKAKTDKDYKISNNILDFDHEKALNYVSNSDNNSYKLKNDLLTILCKCYDHKAILNKLVENKCSKLLKEFFKEVTCNDKTVLDKALIGATDYKSVKILISAIKKCSVENIYGGTAYEIYENYCKLISAKDSNNVGKLAQHISKMDKICVLLKKQIPNNNSNATNDNSIIASLIKNMKKTLSETIIKSDKK